MKKHARYWLFLVYHWATLNELKYVYWRNWRMRLAFVSWRCVARAFDAAEHATFLKREAV